MPPGAQHARSAPSVRSAAASFSFSPPAISLGGSPAGSSPGGFTFASGQAAGGFSFTPPRMRSGSEEGEESPTY